VLVDRGSVKAQPKQMRLTYLLTGAAMACHQLHHGYGVSKIKVPGYGS